MNENKIISLKCPNCSAPASYYENKCSYCGCYYITKGGIKEEEKFIVISGKYNSYHDLISGYYVSK